MERYFFHNEDGKCFPDEHGVELADMAAVRHTAMCVLTEMMRVHEGEFWDEGSWRLTVKDDKGLALFVVDVGVTRSAAVSPAKTSTAPAST